MPVSVYFAEFQFLSFSIYRISKRLTGACSLGGSLLLPFPSFRSLLIFQLQAIFEYFLLNNNLKKIHWLLIKQLPICILIITFCLSGSRNWWWEPCEEHRVSLKPEQRQIWAGVMWWRLRSVECGPQADAWVQTPLCRLPGVVPWEII